MVIPEIECFCRDVRDGSIAAACGRRPVRGQYLKQICWRSEEVFTGVCALIGGWRLLGGCRRRPQHNPGEEADAAKCSGNCGRVITPGARTKISASRIFLIGSCCSRSEERRVGK